MGGQVQEVRRISIIFRQWFLLGKTNEFRHGRLPENAWTYPRLDKKAQRPGPLEFEASLLWVNNAVINYR